MSLSLYIPDKQKATSFDKILAHYAGNSKKTLSRKLKAMLDRWIFCEALLRTHDQATVVSLMISKYRVSNFTALKDLRNTKKLFGAAFLIDKEWERMVAVQQMKQAAQQALDEKKYRDYSGIRKELNALLKLHEDANSGIDPDLLKPNTYVIKIISQNSGKELNMVELSSKPAEEREEIVDGDFVDYEMIADGEEAKN